MYAVIFTARIRQLDDDYRTTAARMRELAMNRYGCTAFNACSEGGTEIAVSYWPSLEHIAAWKADPEHRAAQAGGRARWYLDYRVEVVEIARDYGALQRG